MLSAPTFEHSVLVTDDPLLAAQISAAFVRPGRYLPIMDGPRMSRPDASNEVVRRRNAIIMTGARHVLLGGLPPSAVSEIRPGWENCTISDQYDDHAQTLRGCVKRSKGVLRWGEDNLGVGLYKARLTRQEFQPDLDSSPSLDVVEAGTHLLVACERGDPLAEVTASNLAYACGASFAVFEELLKSDRENWLEEIYALGEGGDVTGRFDAITQKAQTHLEQLDFTKYKTVLFVTAGFPWGIAVPEVPTTHMYRYPDFGRSVIEGLWASQTAERSARNALLIDPQTVHGSEIPAIDKALLANGTLTRVVRGPAATQAHVQFLFELLPHDIIVLSSHAGDAPGEHITYEFLDTDKRLHRLVADRALGISYHAMDDMYQVTQFHRFHSLDGVDWRDKAGLDDLPVETAITTWETIFEEGNLDDYIVASEPIPRVIGSMAIQLHDGIWLYSSHGFSPESAPIIINNSCWSWHELSQRMTFAGARAYLGSLFPITDAEAQEVGQRIFGKYLGQELHRALWHTQQDIYGSSARRPYVMVGLPFIVIRKNVINTVAYMEKAYIEGIAAWTARARNSPHKEIRDNARRFARFLCEDLETFRSKFPRR